MLSAYQQDGVEAPEQLNSMKVKSKLYPTIKRMDREAAEAAASAAAASSACSSGQRGGSSA